MNSVANDCPDLTKCGVIAKAFAKLGGDAMCDEFSTFGGLKCGQVRNTMNAGQIVLHASIRSWDGPRTYKVRVTIGTLCHIGQLRKVLVPTSLFG